MPISFPTSPSVGNTYTVGSKTWSWNGYAWDLQSTSIAPAFNTANAAFDKANSTTYTSNVVISVTDNTNAALRITQTGTADVIRIEDETNPDANVFVIDSAGRVIIGNTVSRVSYDNQQGMLQITNGYGVFPTHIALFSNNTVSSQRTSLRFHKSRPSGPNLTSSSIIGSIEFVGFGNSLYKSGAAIYAQTGSGLIDDTSMPCALVFQTAANGESFSSTRMTIDPTGNVLIGRTNSTVGQGIKLDVNGGINAASLLITGNVGIGTTTPSANLEVVGNFAVSNGTIQVTGTPSLRLKSSGNTDHTYLEFYPRDAFPTSRYAYVGYPSSGSNNFTIMNQASGNFVLGTNNATRITVDNTGNVGIGTATANAKLEVSGSINATDFNSTSDIKLKYNINTLNNSIDVITQINPVSFNWKENDKKSYGVIAQEIESILPEIVSGTDTKHVSYIQLIAFLIGAVKELNEKVEDLKNNCLVSKKGIEDGKV